MKQWLRCIFLIPVVMATVMVANAAASSDAITGTWKGSFDFQGNDVPVTVTLKVDGNTVTGVVTGTQETPAEIHDGKVDGESVTFWVNTLYQGTTYKIVYNGKVTADGIHFSFGTEDGSWGSEMLLKREGGAASPDAAGPAVTGQWEGSFDVNGTSMHALMDLKSSAGVVTGTITGMGPAPIEIHDGKIDGANVGFWINTEYQGQAYTLTFKGTASKDQIDFSFGTSDGAWGTTMTVKKVTGSAAGAQSGAMQ